MSICYHGFSETPGSSDDCDVCQTRRELRNLQEKFEKLVHYAWEMSLSAAGPYEERPKFKWDGVEIDALKKLRTFLKEQCERPDVAKHETAEGYAKKVDPEEQARRMLQASGLVEKWIKEDEIYCHHCKGPCQGKPITFEPVQIKGEPLSDQIKRDREPK